VDLGYEGIAAEHAVGLVDDDVATTGDAEASQEFIEGSRRSGIEQEQHASTGAHRALDGVRFSSDEFMGRCDPQRHRAIGRDSIIGKGEPPLDDKPLALERLSQFGETGAPVTLAGVAFAVPSEETDDPELVAGETQERGG